MNSEKKEKDGLVRRIGFGIVQSIYSRKNTWRGRILKSTVSVGVTLFFKRYGFMKDEIIDADIKFTAEELDAYQYPEDKQEQSAKINEVEVVE